MGEIVAVPPARREAGAHLSRRGFLGGAGALAVAAASPALGASRPPDEAAEAADARGGGAAADRARRAFEIRRDAALHHRRLPPLDHPTNGDEERYLRRFGSFSKGLPHNVFGEVEPGAWQALVAALDSGSAEALEELPLAGDRRLVNPQAGLAFDLEGADPHYPAVPAPPAVASAEAAGEAVELYWMALLRDVPFLEYDGHPEVEAAIADLERASDFRGPREGSRVTARTLFRDQLSPAALSGPYVSQFLWRPAPYGAETIDRRARTALPGDDHLTSWGEWLAVQNGVEPSPARRDPMRRYLRNGRDLAEWVHRDVLFQAYFNACLILEAPPDPDEELTGGGIGCPPAAGNPYLSSRTQEGFATFGPPHFKALIGEVATRALKATWCQKWLRHRRLRPEAYGGLVHLQDSLGRYPALLHRDVLESEAVERTRERHGSALLPMAYPEGSPMHPSYTAGHATVAGACVTVLKALFDESFVIADPVVATADGLALVPWEGPELTVGGELDKLASNVATGRNLAGIHWRSDALESLRLGEEVAIHLLRDHKACFHERFDGFSFTRLDGTRCVI